MEIDTGAAVSLITEETFRKFYPELSLQLYHAILKTYPRECIPVLGEALCISPVQRSIETPILGRHYRKWSIPARTNQDCRI